ncbi:MAG: molecular chaperone DnaJ [Candidatus Nealsonbacteria bacterium]|nr:molecular chaperone DnaJ [Candidatus Nealsonbacteria bacterium]
MPEKRCYYDVLGVDRTATDAQISESYRRLAMKYHPDRNPGDDEAVIAFKEAAEAFEVLSHAEKRSRYDRFGHAGLQGAGGGAPRFHDVSDIFDAFGDMFGDFFGGGGRGGRRRVRRGADVRCNLTLNLLEAANGVAKEVQFERHEKCATCHGSGAKPGTHAEQCPYCGGQGQVIQSTGIFSMRTTCPSCHGTGKVIRDPCHECRGGGYILRQVTRKIVIPAGVDNQTQVRIGGEGEPSPEGGPPGDCYCIISVTEHSLFERNGQHLVCQIPISYSQAALGAKLEVPTLDGPDELKVPAGTQNGEVFQLKGRGMPDPRHRGKGDLLIQVHVEVPKKLDNEHKQLLRRLAEMEQRNVTPERKSFFKRLGEYFHAE